MFLTLITVGIGSCALHGTLHWVGQSMDEIPMLWMNMAILFSLYNVNTIRPRAAVSFSGILLFAMGIMQTIGYYTMRHIYDFFLFSYISSVCVVIAWTCYLVFYDRSSPDYPVRVWLFSRATISFIFIGFSLWVYEMNHCEILLPYYMAASGMTFHVLWHIGSGLGGYLLILLMIAIRIQSLGNVAEVDWALGGILPVVKKGSPKVLLV